MTYRDAFETCPRCAVTLVDARSARGCPQCRGLWLEEPVIAEMVLEMLPPQPLSRLELAVLEPTGDPAACPTCKQPMHATTIHSVLLDRCAKHGVWFDAEELQEALRRVADPSRRPPLEAIEAVAIIPVEVAAQEPELPLVPIEFRFTVTTPGEVTRHVVTDKLIVKIGRAQSATVRVNDPRVSRIHAVIEATASLVTIIDLGSEVGTWVNGRRVNKVHLNSGDLIVVGATTIDVTFRPVRSASS